MIRVKVLSIHNLNYLSMAKVYGNCEFITNDDDDNDTYDYLVVYDNYDKPIQVKCPPENTLHVTTEPSFFRNYSVYFLKQFQYCLGPHHESKHKIKNFHLGPPLLNWFVGNSKKTSFNELYHLKPKKTKLMSVFCSADLSSPEHKKRLDFVLKLKEHFGDQLDIYGRGINPVKDKLEGLVDYKYHLSLENTKQAHYFTEKLADPLICHCYPISSAHCITKEYFPENAFQMIDPEDFNECIQVIEKTIKNDYASKYAEQVKSAKHKVMHDYSISHFLDQFIQNIISEKIKPERKPKLISKKVILPLETKYFRNKRVEDTLLRPFRYAHLKYTALSNADDTT